ncbi:unnamed protein product [Lactuca saligna]|uniref:Large ribosomal subunit protein mL54 n=1 Tax=Lactuca saligna TaxID=75948 RepID=A0AA36DWW9_LACSI|nr:unnamed protein product [Lactuca saligna]
MSKNIFTLLISVTESIRHERSLNDFFLSTALSLKKNTSPLFSSSSYTSKTVLPHYPSSLLRRLHLLSTASGSAAPPPSSLPLPSSETSMAMNCIKSLRNVGVTNSGLGSCRTFAVGGKAKKGKGGGASDAPKQSSLSKEVKSTTVVGANILKEGTDPKILADSEYPEWLWHLLDKKPALSELRRKNIETLPYEDLKRYSSLWVLAVYRQPLLFLYAV